MKKIILFICIFLLSSFKLNSDNYVWVGTFNIYMNDEGLVQIYYAGIVPECISKFIIDVTYTNCDSITNDEYLFYLNKIINKAEYLRDSLNEIKKEKI